MPIRSTTHGRWQVAASLTLGVGLLTGATACGDGVANDGPVTSGEVAAPADTPLADGLIDDLAAIPVPDEVGFGDGVTYDEDEDPGQTAAQMLYFAITASELALFYLDALPAAGFTLEPGGGAITRPEEIVAEQRILIRFTTPDGLPGQLAISPGLLSPSEMNINVYRGGVR